MIPWERFRATVAEAAALARPEEFDTIEKIGGHYAGIRRWSPAFLEAFAFESVPACASLMRAVTVLREANRSGATALPKSAPTGFVRRRWAPYVLPGGTIDRRYDELCVLSELRDHLHAGDVWVAGSRQYRSYEQRLISTEALEELRQAGTLPVAVEPDFDHGLTRMAEACSVGTLGQLAWTSDWHIREETYALALRRLVNQQQREPFAAHFGSGTASSSDGQFFQAAGFGRDAARLNAHYSQRSGFKVYSHLSDRYAPFYTKLIAATASEALHVLDALLDHQSGISPRRHHTDGGGDSDHVFTLRSLLGFQFAPRIPGLKHRRLYSFGKPSAYPALAPMIAARINVALIRAHWSEILRVITSIRTGTATASLIMRQVAAYPRQNGVAAALREPGRLERSLFTLDWISDPELRRETGQELNKGEARNSLARAVFIHRLGEIRDRT